MRQAFVVVGLVVVAVVAVACGAPAVEKDSPAAFRWCVPEELLGNCSRLTVGAEVPIECVAGLDRIDCLRKVRDRQADYLAADPEDLYVAMNLEDQDFVVFGEQRSVEEPTAPFRYEGIMLVRAADGFRSLEDLRGKKSCHTGFGRNVGYKIPVARLQRAGILKLPDAADAGALSQVEKELTALSELFSASCLPGSYSPDAAIDQLLKRRYGNLCERCAAPDRCDRQDRYAGYDGAIRCLAENGGDVAFTKTIFVRKYFGLPVTPGGPAEPALNPAARPDDYVYLCEDGSTRSIADGTPACSWAQRPWPVLVGNGDLRGARLLQLRPLTERLQRYYTEPGSGASDADRAAAPPLRINSAAPLIDRKELTTPRDYLQAANYVEVIERGTASGGAIRLCVTSEPERQKCEVMRQAAYSRDVRPPLHCLLKTEQACVAAVHAGQEVDVVVLKKPTAQLRPIMAEVYDDVMVAVADKNISKDRLQRGTITIDTNNGRAFAAAELLRSKLPSLQVVDETTMQAVDDAVRIRIVRSSSLAARFSEDRQLQLALVCADLSFQPLANAATCHLEPTTSPAAAVYVRPEVDEAVRDGIVHAFTALAGTFGANKPNAQVFRLFGPFRLQDQEGQVVSHLIFHDDASGLVANAK